MRKILLIAVSLVSVNALATKARLSALSNSFHVNDTQSVHNNPLYIVKFDNLVSLETGLTTATSATNGAEAIVYSKVAENANVAVSLGNVNSLFFSGRNFINAIVGAATYQTPQNAVQAFYGVKNTDSTYAMGLMYSNKNDKGASTKESTAGFSLGYKTDGYSVYGSYALINTVEAAAGKKFDGNGAFKLSARFYSSEELTYALDLGTGLNSSSTTGTLNESYGNTSYSVRVVKSMKKDGSEVFYGAGLASTAFDCKTQASVACTTKFSSMTLPFIIGVEANASDLITLRGSVTQTVLLSNSKDDIGLPAAATAGATGALSEFSAGTNNTTVAMGAGLKFNKVTIDGTMSAATTQQLNSTNVLTQVGLTYLF